jgi:DNA-binding CsgD family transcriptional regulator
MKRKRKRSEPDLADVLNAAAEQKADGKLEPLDLEELAGHEASTGKGKVELTPREEQCLELVLAEEPQKAIASRLKISRSTVRTHLASACKKFGTRTAWRAAFVWFQQERPRQKD